MIIISLRVIIININLKRKIYILYKKKKYLGVILARGGSKRVPKKNLRNLSGKPLIAHTIVTALKCHFLDDLIVSSDDIDILKISKKYGAKVILRPKYLAKDNTKSSDALEHIVKQNLNFDFVVLLQPTSPLRNEKHIFKAINFLHEKKADAIISVCKTAHKPYWTNILPKNLSMQNFLKLTEKKFDDYYRINGAIYICRVKKFLSEKSLFLKKNIYAFIMHPKESIDIDTELDFKITKALMKKS